MPEKRRKNLSYEKLRDKWARRHKLLANEIFTKHRESFDWFIANSKEFTIGSLAGIMLLVSPMVPKIQASFSASDSAIEKNIDKRVFAIYDLKNILPQTVQPLTSEENKNIAEVLTRDYGINVSPEIDGISLNTTYGLIGQEQHLARYPGDNMYSHFDNEQNALNYWSYGMASGLGAWGYFAESQSALTNKDIAREKYYIAVQTFLAPGYSKHVKQYNDFFKYRKMLVVNPQNGKAIVADIADAGPASWTGKQLGGSPEVMNYLQRVDGSDKGPVLYFFIDDPTDTIPLGPVNLQ